jgi:outer membrane receptor protein involved in Fe transport
MGNAPIVDDRLAVRVNAYESYTPGYIDNAYTGAQDVNDLRRNGGRVAALWRPSDSLSMKVTAFWDRLSADSLAEVSSAVVSTVPNTGDAYIVTASRPFGDLTENRAFLQPIKQGIDYYAATVRWNAGSLEFRSATAWSHMTTQFSWDENPDGGANFPQWSGGTIPAGLMRSDRDIHLEKFTEEVRIASPQGRRVEWNLGAFYNHEGTTDWLVEKAFDTSYHPIAPFPELYNAAALSTFEARALYGEMTWRLTDHLDLTGGVRHDHNRQEWSVFFASGETYGPQRGSDEVTTWTAAARYRVAPDVMVYGRVATGSQPATMNGFSFPTSNPEMLTSYEVGLKSEFLDHRALFDVSVFYIDWIDIQVVAPGSDWKFINGAQATSRGRELTSSYSPLPGLKLGLVAAFTQCELTEVDRAAAWLLTGYQVPQVPKWSVASSADYDWAMNHVWHAHLGGSFRWIGRQWGLLVTSRSLGAGPTIEKPSYSVLDLNAGIAKDRFAVKVYARNLLDTRAALHRNIVGGQPGPARDIVNAQAEDYVEQPRTIGVGFEFSL